MDLEKRKIKFSQHWQEISSAHQYPEYMMFYNKNESDNDQ